MTVAPGAVPDWFPALTAPRSVAVVGATDKRETFSGAVLTNLVAHGFAGRIFPVNPRRDEVAGLACAPDLASLPERPDCVVMVVSADLAVAGIEEAASMGVPAGIVVASGFTEGGAGEAGAARTARLREALASSGMRVLGPSTTGLINLRDGFVPRAALNQLSADRVTAGPVALLAQSGACGNVVYGMGQSQGLPIGLAVSTGLQLDLDIWDLLGALVAEGRTGTVLLLVEDLGPAARWVPLLEEAQRRDVSVVLCHAGRTAPGALAASTHTGAVAGDWLVEAELARGAGAVVVPALDDLWHVGLLCHRWGRPTRAGARAMGIVSMSGGEGALLADAATEAGIGLPPLDPSAAAAVAQRMPLGAPGNPLDPTGAVMGKPDAARDLVGTFLDVTDHPAYLVALPGLDAFLAREIAAGMLSGADDRPQRQAVSGWWFDDEARDVLVGTGLPVFDSSDTALRAIGHYLGHGLPGAATEDHVADRSADGGSPGRDYWEALDLAVPVGLAVPARRVVPGADEAVVAAEALGFPVVVKANTPSSMHKASSGLVRTGLRSRDDVHDVVTAMAADWDGTFVVEQHVLGDLEVILGVRRSDRTGTVAVFGTGGRMVEQHRDVIALPVDFGAGITPDQLRRTRVGRVIHAARPELLVALSHVLRALVEVGAREQAVSIEINPVVVQLGTGGLVAVDLRLDEPTHLPAGTAAPTRARGTT